MTHLDGNALAGVLFELFATDLTDAVGRCAHCGDRAVIAQSPVYLTPMGAVARCRSCDQVLLTGVESPDDLRIMRAVRAGLQVPRRP